MIDMGDMEDIILGYFDDTLSDQQFELLVKWIVESDANARHFARLSLFERQVIESLRRREVGQVSLGDIDEIGLDELSDSAHASHVISILAGEESTLEDEEIVDITEALICQKNNVRIELNKTREKLDHINKKKNTKSRHKHFVIPRSFFYGGLVAAILMLTFMLQSQLPDNNLEQKSIALVHKKPVVGTLTNGMNLEWSDNGHPVELGSELRQGNFSLKKGFVQVTLKQGASVLFEAPCSFELIDKNTVHLNRGRAVATVPQAAVGFTIHTATSEIVDYGTEFGVEVLGDNGTEVLVFKGLIELRERVENDQYIPIVKKISTGWAGRVDSDGVLDVSLLSPKQISSTFIRKVPESEYAAAVMRSKPLAYWQFSESVRGEYPNTMSELYPCKTIGDIHLNNNSVNHAVVFPKSALTDSYMYVDGVINELRGTREYAIEAWINPTEFNHSTLFAFLEPTQTWDKDKVGNMVMMLEILGGNSEVSKRHNRNAFRFVHRNLPSSEGGTEIGTSKPYDLNRWQHLVAVKRENEMVVYLNGQRIGGKVDNTEVSIAPMLHIGRLHPDFNGKVPVKDVRRNFFGEIDEVAIYDRALTLDEIREHYHQFRNQLDLH